MGYPCHYVGVAALDQVFYSLQCPGTVLEDGGQTHPVGLCTEHKGKCKDICIL